MIFASGELQSWATPNQAEQIRLTSEKLPSLFDSFEYNVQEDIDTKRQDKIRQQTEINDNN